MKNFKPRFRKSNRSTLDMIRRNLDSPIVHGAAVAEEKKLTLQKIDEMRLIMFRFFENKQDDLQQLYEQLKTESAKDAWQALMQMMPYVMPKLEHKTMQMLDENGNAANAQPQININFIGAPDNTAASEHAGRLIDADDYTER